ALAYVQKNNPEECAHIHFIIMAPAPAMIKKVKDEQIKNVHSLSRTRTIQPCLLFIIRLIVLRIQD
ncbi:hypothetical protein, partial [Enterococcus faecium]|uniref:hypothetical protein n=1 Tax=Enterococcus faecium TaxID=1352 RepID=UPI003DA0E23D